MFYKFPHDSTHTKLLIISFCVDNLPIVRKGVTMAQPLQPVYVHAKNF